MIRLVLAAAVCAASLLAQTTYTGNPNTSLGAPFPAFAENTIAVSGATGGISSIRVGLYATDPYEQDSDAWLVPPGVAWPAPYALPAPAGVIELTTDNGGPGANYGTSTEYCWFSSADDRHYPAAAGRIDDGVPPFTAGVYVPEDTPNFHKLYGMSPTGNWKFVFSDDHGFTGNSFVSWRIQFYTEFDIATRATLPIATEGALYNHAIKAVNGTAGYNWGHIGTLPAGLSLQAQGDDYVLSGTPQSGSVGTYIVTVACTDQTSTLVNKIFTIRVTPPAIAAPFLDTFSTDTGWTLGSTWQRGPAVAFANSSSSEPGLDATPGSTDNMILGDGIGATYGVIPQTLFATSPVIDCSQLTSVEVRFWRCLGVRRRDHNFQAKSSVDVSNDGVTWTNIDGNNDADIADGGWIFQRFDITPWAAGKSTVQIRFGIGDNNDTLTLHTGWCVDDFEVRAIPDTTTLTMTTLEILASDTVGSAPNCRVGKSYYVRATLANVGANDVDVDSYVGYVMSFGSPGKIEVVGDFVMATPFTVPGSTSAHTVYGVFNCTGLASTGSGTTLKAELTLVGDQQGTGLRVEAAGTETFAASNTAPVNAAVLVREGSMTGPMITPEAEGGVFAFGTRDIAAGPSNVVTVVIVNQGGAALAVGVPQFVPASAEFVIDATGMLSSIPAGGDTSFLVAFDPITTGAHAASIEIQQGDAVVPSPFVIHLSGDGVSNSPILEVFESGPTGTVIPNGSSATGARAFGSRDISSGAGAALIIYIENTGNSPLTLGVPLLTGNNPGEFLLDLNGMVPSVPPSASTSFMIAYDPASLGAHSATIEFLHNDPGATSPFTFEVSGTGVVFLPVIEVREGGSSGPSIFNSAPATDGRAFGSQPVATGPTPAVTIHVANTGQADLAVGTPLLSGANISAFVVVAAALPAVIAPGNDATFTIAFDPSNAGNKSAIVSFTHNDGSIANPFSFGLSGFGDDPAGVQITTTSLSDGAQDATYSRGLQAQGGTLPYFWSVLGGNLPPGISLATSGKLAGTPTTQGIYAFSARVMDNAGGTADKQFTMTVLAPVSSKNGGTSSSSCSGAGSATPFALAGLILLAAIRRRRELQL